MNKIEVVEIDNLSNPETENAKVMKLSETYWKDYLEQQNYNKDPEKMCEICIEEQIKKHGSQVIPCTGLNRAKIKLGESLYNSLIKDLPEEEIKEMDAIYDPYLYMEMFLDKDKDKPKTQDQLQDRWYQRLLSSCLHGDSLISMSDGTYKKIKDIKKGDKVISYNEIKRTTPVNKVTNVWNQGVKPVYRITLENGDYLDCTKDHPILSHFKSGKENKLFDCPSYKTTYKSLEEGLDVGMDVYILNKTSKWGSFSNTDIAKLLGYIITDGYVQITKRRKRVQLANIRKEYVEEFKEICERIFNCSGIYSVREAYTHPTTGVKRKTTYSFCTNNTGTLNDFLISIGCTNKLNREQSIFDFAFDNFNEECMKVFINRAYSGDGSLYTCKNNGTYITFYGGYKSYLIYNWPKLLRKIGCFKSKISDRVRDTGSGSTCEISSQLSAKNLLDFTGPIFGKEEQSLKIINIVKNREKIKVLKTGKFKTSTRTKIVSIEYLGEFETFDIEVAKRHNFIANGIIVHNCSAQGKVIRIGRRAGKTYTMSLMMVQEMIMTPGYRVLLVSPYAVQTAEVIKTFKDLCSRLPVNPIASAKQTPVHEITFTNGSVLMGFTAATNADSVRGQAADRIVLDECLDGETDILMSDGETKPIKDIKIGDMVLSEIDGYISKQQVINHACTGIKPVYKYIFEEGFELIATENHPVFTSKGEMPISEAKDIKVSPFFKDMYVKLIKSEYLDERPVYNMTVSKSHNYIANGLLTHNCDDIPEAAITSIMAIKMTNPDVKVWRSGTPKGEVNLYRAEQDPQNKCFHYPSYVIPFYNDSIDASLRAEMGDGIGYVQEVLGLCGISSNSVFQSMFINRAQNKLFYITAKDVLQDRSRYIIFIGVDWNHDQVGSRILVIAYDKIVPQFHIIEKEKVEIEGFTQYAAVEKIIQLNRKYNCDHVFCDQGFGATQIADLKKFAMAQVGVVPKGHPDLKLLDVTPVDYGSSTEIRDPVTGEVYKTPTKQLAVLNAVEVFEKDLISLDSKLDHDLILQLKNYIEKSRSKGRIVYGYLSKKIGDHDLDALMIGLFGMKRLYSSLFIGESTQALLKFVNTSSEDQTKSDTSFNDEYEDAGLIGLSYGRNSNRYNRNIRENRDVYGRRSSPRKGRSLF